MRCLFIVVSCVHIFYDNLIVLVHCCYGGKCCAPKFRSGYQGVDMTDITMHKFQEKWKEKLPRGGEWKVTKNTYICSKHFAEGDFVTNTQDKKKNRAMKRNCSLLRRYLRKDAFLSVFPNCPRYLSISKRVPRTATATSSERQAVVLF